MRVLIQPKEWSIKDIRIGHLIRHYTKENRIHKLDSEEKIFNFLQDMVHDIAYLDNNFENCLLKTHKDLTMQEVYYHFLKADSFIPKLFIATYKNGHYSHISQITTNALAEMVREITA